MTKVKAQYETITVGKKRIRLKFWPAEKVSYPGVPQYIGVLTRVKPEMMESVEKEISSNHKIKGIFYPGF
jgi:hypothetical protein